MQPAGHTQFYTTLTDATFTEGALPLAQVVSATGLSADILRAWERRYGFPRPLRDASGQRLFPHEQVERLGLVRRLVDAGARPTRVVALPRSELLALLGTLAPEYSPALQVMGLDADTAHALRLVEECRIDDLKRYLALVLARRGARGFVMDLAAPLVRLVGQAWHAGRIEVHQEHACSEALLRLLGQAAQAMLPVTTADVPTVLLTTCPGESHALGLAMVEVLLLVEGCRCIGLGAETPPDQIVQAATSHDAGVVALSFSSFYKPRRAIDLVERIRKDLPAAVSLWVGGACSGLSSPLPTGVIRFDNLEQITPAVGAMRARIG